MERESLFGIVHPWESDSTDVRVAKSDRVGERGSRVGEVLAAKYDLVRKIGEAEWGKFTKRDIGCWDGASRSSCYIQNWCEVAECCVVSRARH